MKIKNPGTVTFWFDPENNPKAFNDDNKIMWGKFKINDETCIVTSEGNTLVVTMNPETENELMIFRTSISPDNNEKHMVAVTWSAEKLSLYFDGQLLEDLNPAAF